MAGSHVPGFHNGATGFTGRVLHVVDAELSARWGPMLRQTLSVLVESGLHVSLVTNDADLIAGLSGTDVECHRVEHLGGWRGWRLGEVLSERLSQPPTVIHLWGAAGLGWVRRWAQQHQVPLVIHALGTAAVERIARRGLRAGERIAVASSALATSLSRRSHPTVWTWQTVPPAVALPVRRGPDREGPRTLGILCVSGLDDVDSLGTLIDAIAQLRRGGADVQVVIIGDGHGAGAIWQRIQERKVHDCCVVIDEPKLWEKGLTGADVCVVPGCQREMWLAPLLAMGLGKLVIASRDQLADWFVEGRTAWQFTPGSAVELAYLLARVVEQPGQVRQTTDTAAEYFNTHHSVSDLVERLAALYQAATGSRVAEDLRKTRRTGVRDDV